MAYTRKTTDEFILLCNYGYGWEEILTEETKADVMDQLRTYSVYCKI